MSKYSKLIKDAVIFGIGNFTTKLIYFFLMPIYTIALSTEEFGVADLLNNSLQLIIPILTISISDAVFRFSLDKDINHQELLANGLRILKFSYFIAAIFIGIVYTLKLELYWSIFAILYITESLKSLFAQFTRGLGKVTEYAINGIIAAGVLLLCTYIFLRVFHWGINGYLLAFVAANLCSSIYLIFVVEVRKYIDIRCVNKTLLKSMIAFSLPLTPNMLSWWITNISSRYIIAYFSGFALSGLFAAASKVPALINIISSIFQLSWQFASVKEYQESSKSEFYSVVLKYYNLIIVIFGSIIITCIPWISKFILKGEFYEAWIYTPLLLFSAMLGCYSVFLGTFYSVVKENKKAMNTTFIGAGINLILCLISIPFLGVMGALVANVVSYTVVVILRWHDCTNYVTLNIQKKAIIIALCIVLCQCFLIMKSGIYRQIAYSVPIIIFFLYWKDLSELYLFMKRTFHHKIFKG